MAIYYEGIIGGDLTGTFEGTRDFTEQHRYLTTGQTRSQPQFTTRSRLPMVSPIPDFIFAYCLDKKVKSAGTTKKNGAVALIWDVDIHWGPLEPVYRDGEVNPLDLPPVWRFDPENEPKILYEDFQGNPLVNSAGDYNDPPITRPQVRGLLTARKNFAIDDPIAQVPTLIALANKLNSDTVGVYPPKTLKSTVIPQPEPTYKQGSSSDFRYYELVFGFQYNPDTWEEEIIDRGYRKLVDGKPVRILDLSGQDIRQPAFLDGEGGESPLPLTEVVTLPFVLEESVEFSSIFDFLGSDWRNV